MEAFNRGRARLCRALTRFHGIESRLDRVSPTYYDGPLLSGLVFERKNRLGQQDVDAFVAFHHHARAISGRHCNLQPLRLGQGELVFVESHENLSLKFQGDRHMPQVK